MCCYRRTKLSRQFESFLPPIYPPASRQPIASPAVQVNGRPSRLTLTPSSIVIPSCCRPRRPTPLSDAGFSIAIRLDMASVDACPFVIRNSKATAVLMGGGRYAFIAR